MFSLRRKPAAKEIAAMLANVRKVPNCEDCDVLRGANLLAREQYSRKYASLFDENLSSIITTHVNLNCEECPVDDILKRFRRDRSAAVAALI